MVRKFKLYGQRYLIDINSLAVHRISELQYDMLTYLRLPFENVFPSGLRYDLAKYESSKLSDGYLDLRALNTDGVFESNSPLTVNDITPNSPNPEKTIVYNKTKFVFASEVLKLADKGAKIITAIEDKENKVNKSDFDILSADYERIAKELIKRKTGRVPFEVFDFVPFDIPFSKDEKGYEHIADSSVRKILNSDDEIAKKIIECAVAVHLL